MTCGNKDEKPKNEAPQQQLSKKIEPNLPKILRDFSELLEIKYGLSGFTVTEFKLLPELEQQKLSEDNILQVARLCIYICGSERCETEC